MAKKMQFVEASRIDDQVSGLWDDGMISSEGWEAECNSWKDRLRVSDEDWDTVSHPRSDSKLLGPSHCRSISQARLLSSTNLGSEAPIDRPIKRPRSEVPVETSSPAPPPPSTPPLAKAISSQRNPTSRSKRRRPSSVPDRPHAESAGRAASMLPMAPERGLAVPSASTASSPRFIFSPDGKVPEISSAWPTLRDFVEASRSQIGLLYVDPTSSNLRKLVDSIVYLRRAEPIRLRIYHINAIPAAAAQDRAPPDELLITEICA